jgi:solute:Na+ symporter, SSS family
MSGVNGVAFSIFVILFLLVTGIGFAAARWRRAEDMLHLNEWGLGGRGFGTVITWFLLGGDLYTAYTFIAVPALIYGVGAAGFFAVPYTVPGPGPGRGGRLAVRAGAGRPGGG